MDHSDNEMVGGAMLTARDPVYRERPHERLDALRAAYPVFQDRAFDRVVLTRAADVAAMLADRGLSADPFTARPTAHSRRGLTEADRGSWSMLHMDDPDHARLRRLVAQALTARAVQDLRPRLEAIAADLLDHIDPRAPFDLLPAYAAPLPALIIAVMLGIDDGNVLQFKQWSDDVVAVQASERSEDGAQRSQAALLNLQNCIRKTLAERRAAPRSDLISALAQAEADGDHLSEAEIVSTSFLLLVAGNITTTDTIGNGVVALLRHPDQLARLLVEPGLWPAAVEEVLRYDPPVTALHRQATKLRAIGGCPVEAGQTVTAMVLAANHDPSLHAEPRRFDVGRTAQKHHSFGNGAHFCLGASLARLEMQVALPALFARFPRLRLTPGRALSRKNVPGFNGFEAVWLSAE